MYGIEHDNILHLCLVILSFAIPTLVVALFALLCGISFVDIDRLVIAVFRSLRDRLTTLSRRAVALCDRILDNARLRTALATERARADRLAVELATVRGMNHMCTALAHRVGAYNS